ncbi:MAG TPA: DUF4097 family beta strand repeat-containing protein [Rhodanobacteraceae bacterium]|jgi:DUF4097 and DUF4098 domain-containing protein YvlB|nr:DUF4097 family beta strand repeat-containing protein [Rhodanobacteraceae bacterium]
MNNHTHPNVKRFALPAGLLFALLAATLPAFAGTPVDKTVTATPNGHVQVSSVAGSIKVTAWNRNEVHVTGSLSRNAERLAVEKTGTGVNIQVVLPQHSSGNMEGSDLVIEVPAASQLEVHTVSADIDAGGLGGPVRLESVSGNVGLVSSSANIYANTISGDVRVTGSAPGATIEGHSISGKVLIEKVNGSLRAGSTSGDIELTGENSLQAAKLDTTSGDVHFAAALGADGDYEFHSVSGNVVLSLPKVPAGSFDVSSFSGDIDTDFGPQPKRSSEFGPGKEWHYQSGSGQADIRIRTLSGDVRISAAH